MRCPGSDNRNISIKHIECMCGEILEVFTDEKIRRCPRCDMLCMINGIPKCFEWCKFAEKCKNEYL